MIQSQAKPTVPCKLCMDSRCPCPYHQWHKGTVLCTRVDQCTQQHNRAIKIENLRCQWKGCRGPIMQEWDDITRKYELKCLSCSRLLVI